MKYSVVIFGVKDISGEFIKYVHENVCKVDLVVTIDEALTKSATVSGYGSMNNLETQYGIKVLKTSDYGLKDFDSEKFFSENEFDIGISMNWSRLIPEKILKKFKIGVFGLHGSCGYLPYGQGRATLNWSLINDERRYVMHMFKLDEGVDSPNIYARTMFEINEFDDIRTLQYKDYMSSKLLANQLLSDYKSGKEIKPVIQDKDPQMVYPGRKPEDGRIDILASSRKIYRLVRAVTHPFPGAYLYFNKETVLIWKVRPFDGILDFSKYKLGEIIDVIDENLILRTVDGSIIIEEYDSETVLQAGDVLY